MANQKATSTGIGLGSVLAAVISWSLNKSVWWAFLHGVLGWLYVIYACCAYTDELNEMVAGAKQEIRGDEDDTGKGQ